MNPQRVIGHEQKIPWHLPADLNHFKKRTLNKTIIMGRKTYESIGKALPRRRNIVLSRNITQLPDAEVFASLDAAIANCQQQETIMVIGGEHLYRLSLPLAKQIILTEVACECDGDTYFPEFDEKAWSLQNSEEHHADANNQYAYTFQEWHRE